MLVLDTNTISYYFRNEPCVVQQLQATPLQQIAVPAIVVYELKYGILRLPREAALPRLKALAKFLQFLSIIDVDKKVAELAAQVRVDLETIGLPIGAHDVLIAASALSVNGQLVTRNGREFERVQGLQVVNWFD
jgi:tRNA(fMet)-specific endonuclease VapC